MTRSAQDRNRAQDDGALTTGYWRLDKQIYFRLDEDQTPRRGATMVAAGREVDL